MMKALVGAVLIGLTAIPVAARAQDAVASRVQAGLDSRMQQPECKVTGGDFRVSSGKTYLKTGIEGTGDVSNRVNALKNGVRVLTEAITSSGQGNSSAAWYWLGRTYLQQGDLIGADSAFTKTLALAPACKEEIRKLRYRAWAALVNAGGGFRQAQRNDSALIMYRAANVIYQDAPLAFVNVADIFHSMNQDDSALVYFGRAAMTQPTDSAQVNLRDQSLFNYSVMLLNAGRPKDAIDALHRVLAVNPRDATAQKALAQAFRAAGMADSAQAIEREVVAAAGGTPGAEGDESISEADLMDIAVKQFNDKNYADAAATFGRLISINPWNRDAIFNQANAYLALKDGAKLSATAEKLIGIEPLSEYAYSLRAQGYKLAGKQDDLLKVIVAREALPVNLEVEAIRVTADGATLDAKVTGREARNENNKLIPAKAQIVVVEFITVDGSVVASQNVPVAALKPGESAPFKAEGKGAGIKSWRYRVQ
jgi:tetratricopeptide (TPR) repeat protein